MVQSLSSYIAVYQNSYIITYTGLNTSLSLFLAYIKWVPDKVTVEFEEVANNL